MLGFTPANPTSDIPSDISIGEAGDISIGELQFFAA